jgi:hypothetical protein
VGLVFIAQSKLRFWAFTERSHNYVRNSTAYKPTNVSFGNGIIIPRNTDRYKPKIPIWDTTI